MKRVTEEFGKLVFDDREMKARLSSKVYGSLKKTISDSKFYLFRLSARRIAAMVVDTMVFWAVLIIFIMQLRIWIM